MEYWRIENKDFIFFLNPIFHYSAIPVFHWTRKVNSPLGVKSKPGVLMSESLLSQSVSLINMKSARADFISIISRNLAKAALYYRWH